MFEIFLPFGVELEFTRDLGEFGDFETVCNNALLPFRKHVHRQETPLHWTLKEDGSCGYELTTPVLKDDRDFQELLEVAGSIQTHYGTRDLVNRSCGLHVHFDVNGLTRRDLVKVFEAFSQAEPFLFNLCPRSRQRNSYCHPIARPAAGQHQPRGDDEDDEWDDDVEDYAGSLPMDHYAAVNLGRWNQRGTMEVRYQTGTCDRNKLLGWISFLQGFIRRAANESSESQVPAITNLEQFWAWQGNPSTTPDRAIQAWVNNRFSEFQTRSNGRSGSNRETYAQAVRIRGHMDELHQSYHYAIRREMNREQRRAHDRTILEYERTGDLNHSIPEEWITQFYISHPRRAPEGWLDNYYIQHPELSRPRQLDRDEQEEVEEEDVSEETRPPQRVTPRVNGRHEQATVSETSASQIAGFDVLVDALATHLETRARPTPAPATVPATEDTEGENEADGNTYQ